jgi:hypothetical protein
VPRSSDWGRTGMAGIRSIKSPHHTGGDMDANCVVRRLWIDRLKMVG